MAYPLSNSIAEYLAIRPALAPAAATGAAQAGALIDRQGFLSGVAAISYATSGGATGGAVWGYWQSTIDPTGVSGWTNVLSAQPLNPAAQQVTVYSLSAVTVSGGTGYVVGDTITLAAGFPIANGVSQGGQTASAVLKVTTVTAGAITGVAIQGAGVFSAPPISLTQAATSGVGSGAGFTTPVFVAGLAANPAAQAYPIYGLTSLAVSGGSGYAVNDVITLAAAFATNNGVAQGSQISVIMGKVTSVASGAITGFAVLNPGAFTAVPIALAQSWTSGVGTGAAVSAPLFGNVFTTVIGAGPNASGVLSAPINLAFANRYVRVVVVGAPTGGTPAATLSAAAFLAGADHLPTA